MDDDGDEDVVFENSPLHKHLQSVGMDVNPEPVASKTANEQQFPQKTPCVENIIRQCCSDIWLLLKKFCRKSCDCLLPGKLYHQQWSEQCSRRCLLALSECSVLQEEDVAVLERYVRDTDKTPTSSSSLTRWPFPLVWCLGVCSAAVFVGERGFSQPGFLGGVTTTAASALLGLVAVNTGLSVWCWWHRCQAERSLQRFLSAVESLSKVCRSSLRLVQEKELVARGFTLVAHRSAVVGLELGRGSATLRQCPELRKALFLVLRDCIMEARKATLSLIHLHPLSHDLDSIMNYLSGLPLAEYGPCLQVAPHTAAGLQEVRELTDGFSIAALKGMSHLCSVHLSELVRRLALCFAPLAHHTDSRCNAVRALTDTENLVLELSASLSGQAEILSGSYHFHRSPPITASPQHRAPAPSSTEGDHQELYVAIHSLDLHLQAAWSKVRQLADQLESLRTQGQCDADSEVHAENHREALMLLKAELDACRACWEDSLAKLDKKTPKLVPKLEGCSPGNEKLKEAPRPAQPASDYIIQDQVFEAYSDPDDLACGDSGWEPILSPEEQIKKRREREEALRMLHELKSVISIRARDMSAREQAALERMERGDAEKSGSVSQGQSTSDLHRSRSANSEAEPEVAPNSEVTTEGQDPSVQNVGSFSSSNQQTDGEKECCDATDELGSHDANRGDPSMTSTAVPRSTNSKSDSCDSDEDNDLDVMKTARKSCPVPSAPQMSNQTDGLHTQTYICDEAPLAVADSSRTDVSVEHAKHPSRAGDGESERKRNVLQPGEDTNEHKPSSGSRNPGSGDAATGSSLPEPRFSPTATGFSLPEIGSSPTTMGSSLPGPRFSPTTTRSSLPEAGSSLTATGSSLPEGRSSPTATGSSLPNARSSPTAMGSSLPEGRSSPTATGSSLLEAGSSLTAAGSSLPEVGSSPTAMGSSLPNARSSPTATGSSLPEDGTSLMATGSSLPAAGSSLTATGSSLPEAGTSSTATGPSLPDARSSPSAMGSSSSEAGSSLTASVAAMAAAMSHQFTMNVQMYGESSDSDFDCGDEIENSSDEGIS